MIDLIGDIHGHADKLVALLSKMGYTMKNGAYAHPERKVLFIGDYIDKGPNIRETLHIVKAMVDSENAIALMGNHEYNAICFHTEALSGGHLRRHNIKNIIQHFETLQQFKDWEKEYEDYLKWFMTLPLYYETDHFRAVHACWDHTSIEYLRHTLVNDRLTDVLLHQSVKEETALYKAIDITLKGKEMQMPKGPPFLDAYGSERYHIRIKWWEDPAVMNYQSICVKPNDAIPENPIILSELTSPNFYSDGEKNVFFGHYWLEGEPSLFRNNICCLDYSVAKGGLLVACRLSGESRLDNSQLIYV